MDRYAQDNRANQRNTNHTSTGPGERSGSKLPILQADCTRNSPTLRRFERGVLANAPTPLCFVDALEFHECDITFLKVTILRVLYPIRFHDVTFWDLQCGPTEVILRLTSIPPFLWPRPPGRKTRITLQREQPSKPTQPQQQKLRWQHEEVGRRLAPNRELR